VITRDVPPYALMLGVPARRRGWVCRCGTALPDEGETRTCPACGDRYRADAHRLEPLT
jgi:UDP-2-acetamido-3-amino-2,3-dideoxy-glucuronate N-acetyltransferase